SGICVASQHCGPGTARSRASPSPRLPAALRPLRLGAWLVPRLRSLPGLGSVARPSPSCRPPPKCFLAETFRYCRQLRERAHLGSGKESTHSTQECWNLRGAPRTVRAVNLIGCHLRLLQRIEDCLLDG